MFRNCILFVFYVLILTCSCSKDTEIIVTSDFILYDPVGESSVLMELNLNEHRYTIGGVRDVVSNSYIPQVVIIENENSSKKIAFHHTVIDEQRKAALYIIDEKGVRQETYVTLSSEKDSMNFIDVYRYNWETQLGDHLTYAELSTITEGSPNTPCRSFDPIPANGKVGELLTWLCQALNTENVPYSELKSYLSIELFKYDDEFLPFESDLSAIISSLDLFAIQTDEIPFDSEIYTSGINSETRNNELLDQIDFNNSNIPSFKTPTYKVVLLSGNNQCMAELTNLNNPIKIGVYDYNTNNPKSGFSLDLKTFGGINGNFTSDNEMTNSDGELIVNWQLGTSSTQNAFIFIPNSNPFDYVKRFKIEANTNTCGKFLDSQFLFFKAENNNCCAIPNFGIGSIIEARHKVFCEEDSDFALLSGCNEIVKIVYVGENNFGVEKNSEIEYITDGGTKITTFWTVIFGGKDEIDIPIEVEFADGQIVSYKINIINNRGLN